jgi:hypothetical protein
VHPGRCIRPPRSAAARSPCWPGPGAEAQACFTSTSVRTFSQQKLFVWSLLYHERWSLPVVLSLGAQHEVTRQLLRLPSVPSASSVWGMCFACGKAFRYISSDVELSAPSFIAKAESSGPVSSFSGITQSPLTLMFDSRMAMPYIAATAGEASPRSIMKRCRRLDCGGGEWRVV